MKNWITALKEVSLVFLGFGGFILISAKIAETLGFGVFVGIYIFLFFCFTVYSYKKFLDDYGFKKFSDKEAAKR